MFGTLWQDLRHGCRMLLHNPGFTVVAIASIGIGVGANAAMFSLADGLLLRPLNVPRPGEVLSIVGTSPEGGLLPPGLSYPDYVDLRERTRTFAALVAHRNVLTAFDARADQPALRTLGTAVNAGMFEAMGVPPALGRVFRPDEDVVPGRDAVVVLDHRTWRDRFGADPAVVGRRVRITNTDFTVIGVVPESFNGLDLDVWPGFYVPLAMLREVQYPPTEELTRRDIRGLEVRGRLAQGATLAHARQEIARIGADLATAHPETNRNQELIARTEYELRMAGPDATLVVMLTTLAVVVLLVACANVAGLLASRVPVRAREVALRMAIGAGRLRLIRQLVTESFTLAGGGAIVGLVIAYGGIWVFRQVEPPTEVPLKIAFELDRRVLAIALIVAAASAVLSSVIPAWHATRTDLVTMMKASAGGSREGRRWGRHSLVALQAALSLLVVTVAAALYGGFQARLAQGPGYRTDGLLLMRFDERLTGYDRDRSRQFYRLLKERAQAIPGVTSVALTSMVPLKSDTLETQRVAPEGVRLPDDASDVGVMSSRVDEGFFPTLAIPLVAGRPFSAADHQDAPKVAVVNRAFADRYWPDQRAIGRRVRVRPLAQGEGEWFEVVGVAANSKYAQMVETAQPFIYLPTTQSVALEQTLLVQTSGDPEALVRPLREVVHAIDPNMPVFGVRTMKDLYESRGVRIPAIIVGIVGTMGGMGLALALVGLYGLVAYEVGRQTRAIGIRMAIGAPPSSVVAAVLQRAVVLTMGGLVLGAVGSVAVGRVLDGAVPGIGNFGPATYAIVVPALFAVTWLAAYIPARRAVSIDPLDALRTE